MTDDTNRNRRLLGGAVAVALAAALGGFGDPVRAGETLAILESRDAAQIAADFGPRYLGECQPGCLRPARNRADLRTGAGSMNGQEAVIGTVLMLISQNSRVVAEQAAARLDRVAKTLPSGIQVMVVLDRADLVDATTATVKRNLAEGAAGRGGAVRATRQLARGVDRGPRHPILVPDDGERHERSACRAI